MLRQTMKTCIFSLHFLGDYSLKTLNESQRIRCFIERKTLVLWLLRRFRIAFGNHKKYTVDGFSVLAVVRIPTQQKVVSILWRCLYCKRYGLQKFWFLMDQLSELSRRYIQKSKVFVFYFIRFVHPCIFNDHKTDRV